VDHPELEETQVTHTDWKNRRGSRQFWLHIKALFIKRCLIYRRSYKAFVMELLIPIVLIVVGFQLSKISFFFDSPSKELTPSSFGGPQRFLLMKDTLLSSGTDDRGRLAQVLTPKQFAANLPGGSEMFRPIYVDMQAKFPADPYTEMMRA
jgi:hypothetical protein